MVLRGRAQADAGRRLIRGICVDVTEEALAEQREVARREKRERQARVLVDLARGMAAHWGDLDRAAKRLAAIVGETLGVDRTGVWLYEESAGRVRSLEVFERDVSLAPPCAGVDGQARPSTVILEVAALPRFLGALESERLVVAADAQEDPVTGELRASYLAPFGVRSLIAVGVRIGGALVGALCLENVSGRRVWTQEEQEFACAAADLLALAIESSRRARAENARAALETKLRDAQKLESLGLLAGGVAHDFNNLLTPILAYADSALATLSSDHPLSEDLGEILTAARRARDVTAQLLAFGRRQVLEVQPLDLNEQVRAACRMLTRVLPAKMDIVFDLAAGAPPILADPTQMQQVLINLVVNARDAMSGGGTLTIKSELGPRDALGRATVRLSLEDTGCGMDAETAAQIFEPFFTTKERGHGTGLGLATVYGIVQQHGGSIEVDSAIGRGTRFVIVLPQAHGAPRRRITRGELGAVGRAGSPEGEPPPRAGTILVVEDEEAVRKLVARILGGAGYRVLAAGDIDEAVSLVRSFEGAIDLLLTDVILPHANGKEVFERLRSMRPELPVLYMSGHAQDVLGQDGVIDDEVHFLPKPFSSTRLSCKVGEVLALQRRV
jgi:signal transduction histidine kinase/CheY-like chemotaxis protein